MTDFVRHIRSDETAGAVIDTDDIEVFLVLAEELHFTRTAQRLHLSTPQVSRVISALERRVGGTLFERTSRRVRLTPVGATLRDRLRPVYMDLLGAFDEARARNTGVSGELRVGCTWSTTCTALSNLLCEFEATHPECRVVVHEIDVVDPYSALRAGTLDVAVNWQFVDGPDLTVGSVLEYRQRALAVSTRHRLAGRASVSTEDIADECVPTVPPTYPTVLREAFLPSHSASGRPMRGVAPSVSPYHTQLRVAQGEIVHPTAIGVNMFVRDDIVLVPISDLPPMPLGPIWCTANESALIRALDDTICSDGAGDSVVTPT